MSDKPNPALQRLERAKIEAELAKKRLSTTMGALQYRLKPATLANDAWNGMKEKSNVLTDNALQAVKDRPVTASGILAAFLLFLARDPVWHLISSFFRDEEEGLVQTDLSSKDDNYDLAAPPVARSARQGVDA